MDGAGILDATVLIRSASDPVTTTHNALKGESADPVLTAASSLGKRLGERLRSLVSFLKLGGMALVIGLAAAVGWAWYYRAGVQLVPFEGADGAAMSLRLARALDDVALGSTSGILVDKTLQLDGDNGPPAVSIPGTGLSLASLVSAVQVGPLAKTRVRGAIVAQDNTYSVSLQVFGWTVGEKTTRTEAATDPDKALVQAAEQLYGMLKPIALASYLYSRDSKRCLEVIADVLSDSKASAEDKVQAYHLWGLVLRNQQDFEGARARFQDAIELAKWPVPHARRSKAQVWVDIGHTFQWEQRWQESAAAYRNASEIDHAWAVPQNFLGDTARESGDLADAIRRYNEAIDLDGHYVDPWNGLGRTHAAQGHYAEALTDYIEAHRRQLRSDGTAASTFYGLGDVLFNLGCLETASALYRRALEIDPSLQEKQAGQYDWASTHRCQPPRPSDGASMCSRCPISGPAAAADPLYVRTDANESGPLEALLVSISRVG